jgi:dynactin complex subunit
LQKKKKNKQKVLVLGNTVILDEIMAEADTLETVQGQQDAFRSTEGY